MALISGKAIYLGLAFVLPMTRHHWPTVVLTFLAISMLMGIIFSVVFPEPRKPVRIVAGIKLMGESKIQQVGSVPKRGPP